MGHIGFSWVGIIWLAMLFIPNVIWSRRRPEGYSPDGERKLFAIPERLGQAAVCCCLLIFSDTNVTKISLWSVWFFAALALMLLYLMCWVRYFVKPTLWNMYRPFLLIPIPLALLPCISVILLSVYGKLIWLGIAAAILTFGHVGIFAGKYMALKKDRVSGAQTN